MGVPGVLGESNDRYVAVDPEAAVDGVVFVVGVKGFWAMEGGLGVIGTGGVFWSGKAREGVVKIE